MQWGNNKTRSRRTGNRRLGNKSRNAVDEKEISEISVDLGLFLVIAWGPQMAGRNLFPCQVESSTQHPGREHL